MEVRQDFKELLALLNEHLEGKPVEKDIKVRVELITKENANTFDADK
jgi:ABC-type sugar transport system substrate-binding protein